MFQKIVLVISLLFFVANAAKYKVRDGNLRKVAKDVKVKAVSKVKAHLEGFKKNAEVKKIGKALTEAKNLKAWNTYDPTFDQKYWMNSFAYISSTCTGDVIEQYSEYYSYCYVGTIDGSNSQTYGSAQILLNSDCTQETIAFYTSNDCSGTPAAQGNTAATGYVNTCQATSFDDDGAIKDISSVQSTCSGSATSWTGGDAVKISTFEQTDTCSGDATAYNYRLGGCYETVDGGSIEYMSGPSFSVYDTTDCTGSASFTVTPQACEEDDGTDDPAQDDPADDDDDLVDDGMITNVVANTDSSDSYSWTGASSTLVLNYYLSAALVVVFCTLSL